MPSIFTQIIQGQIPCYKIAEDEHHIAFLDINPLQLGHTLVVPKEEVDYILDLNDQQTTELHLFAKRVALAIQKTCPCKKVASFVIGLDVPHVHVHLVPINTESDLHIDPEHRKKRTPQEMQDVATKIAAQFI